jgi:SAM-dependent methyltransferase
MTGDLHRGADPSPYREIAEIYAAARPDYPGALVDPLMHLAGVRAGDAVAEIGAGTGIFTRHLASRKLAVVAVEPIAEMRAQAPSLDGVRWTEGTFDATGLPATSQAWVVAAQSFQWASPELALPELHRILEPGGWFTVLWNAHRIDFDPVLRWTYQQLRRFAPKYDYVDRTTTARRLASHSLGSAPERVQRWLVAGSARLGDPGRLSRGLASGPSRGSVGSSTAKRPIA